MILVCKDFKFDGKTLSSQNFSSLNFDSDTSLPSYLSREMDAGEMNQYRPIVNGFGIRYTDTLNFDLHIAKNFDEYTSQDEMEFSSKEYDSLVSWLTSPTSNEWMTVTTESNETFLVCGYFSQIEPYDNWGICYGAKCTFICNSPYSYVEKETTQEITGTKNFLINNEGSELYDYVYPVLNITPTKNEEILIHNLSDTNVLESGVLNLTEDPVNNMKLLQQKIEIYAKRYNLTVTYIQNSTTNDIQMFCNNTGVPFYMEDRYGVRNKYFAYYIPSNKQYYIVQSGLFYCTLLKDLPITIDCRNMAFYDALDRPVLFNEIGLQDEDEIYWPRFIHGNNSFFVSGNFTMDVTYMEPRKGGLI